MAGAATQIAEAGFDRVYPRLSPAVRQMIQVAVDEMGRRLESFPHHRLQSSPHFRLRVGDYRVIYTFDVRQNVIHLLAVGHRREIYR